MNTFEFALVITLITLILFIVIICHVNSNNRAEDEKKKVNDESQNRFFFAQAVKLLKQCETANLSTWGNNITTKITYFKCTLRSEYLELQTDMILAQNPIDSKPIIISSKVTDKCLEIESILYNMVLELYTELELSDTNTLHKKLLLEELEDIAKEYRK